MWQEHYVSLAWAISVVALTVFGRFLFRLYFWRGLCHNLPGPPHHPLWGHLDVAGKVMQSLPSRAAPQSLIVEIQRQYNLPDIFYFDTFPFGPPMLVAMHPDISNQFTVKQSLPKHPVVADFTEAFGGRENLVSSDGMEWKTWRSAFNPGFSASHLMKLMPDIVEDVSVFCQVLEDRAKTCRPFRMEHHATRLTIDIIGKVVLDTRFNSQLSENDLVSAFESQVRWIPTGSVLNVLEFINIFRPLVIRYNTWKMNRYISNELEKRFASREKRGKTKHVIDLALETYLKENQTKGATGSLDPEFKRRAIDNVNIFIFAGHDTSSSSICYCFYHLSRNQEALSAMRREIKEIFGFDPSKIGELIKDDPWLLNKMDYGLAVIREVLRLHPPASSVRAGAKDFFIVDPETSERYPTEHFMLWASNMGIHRNKAFWGEDVDVFRPERWIDPETGTCLNRDANVAFSKGIRNCIGQELALLELRMVLAMTIAKFDFAAAFDELDELRNDGSGYPSDSTGIHELFGEQAYQIQLGTAKPREGMPCRIRLAQPYL